MSKESKEAVYWTLSARQLIAEKGRPDWMKRKAIKINGPMRFHEFLSYILDELRINAATNGIAHTCILAGMIKERLHLPAEYITKYKQTLYRMYIREASDPSPFVCGLGTEVRDPLVLASASQVCGDPRNPFTFREQFLERFIAYYKARNI